MSRIIISEGRTWGPDDPGYEKACIAKLQEQVMELQTAIVDLQNRVSRLDGEDLQWPADIYPPTHTKPA